MPVIIMSPLQLVPQGDNVKVTLNYTLAYTQNEVDDATAGKLRFRELLALIGNDTKGWVWNIQSPPPVTLDGTELFSQDRPLSPPTSTAPVPVAHDFLVARKQLDEDPGIFGAGMWVAWTAPDDDEIRARVTIVGFDQHGLPVKEASSTPAYSNEVVLKATEGYHTYIAHSWWYHGT